MGGIARSQIRLAARVRDLGKIAVPDEVLHKQRSLGAIAGVLTTS
jgi:response regulator RpfG family c-di-GMP phosphodiesterase